MDIIGEYLDELEVKSKRLKLPVNIRECDMRRIDFQNEFDAAGNISTSFGYFARESDNMLVMRKLYKALKPGGKSADSYD